MREFRYWTCTERRRVIEMANAGVPHREIAKALGRPYFSVKTYLGRWARGGEVKPRVVHLEDVDLSKAHPVIRRIFEVAARDGYTFEILAKRSGISRPTIRDMVYRGNPQFKNLLIVAQTVNVKVTASMMQAAA
jgi:transposase